MNKNIFYFFTIIFFVISLNGKLLTNRNLLIFNECGNNENITETLEEKDKGLWGPKGIGAVSINFIIALYQEPGVIIASGPLVNNILDHKAYYDQTFPKITEFEDVYKKISEIPFHKYIIKKIPYQIDNISYLFIPKSYLNKIDINYVHMTRDVVKYDYTFEPIEKELGLRFNHFQDVELTLPKTDNYLTYTSNKPHGFGPDPILIKQNKCRKALAYAIEQIFIPIDKHKESLEVANVWAIYLIGHGAYDPEAFATQADRLKDLTKEKTEKLSELANLTSKSKVNDEEIQNLQKDLQKIDFFIERQYTFHEFLGEQPKNVVAGFLISEFQKLLKFFNNKIHTGFLFYSSCYSAGKNFKDSYKDLTQDYPLTLNYTIASDTVAEAPSSIAGASISIFDDPTAKATDFNKFFNSLSQHSDKPIPYKEIFSYVSDFLGQKKLPDKVSSNFLQNIPSIRFPGTNWFSVIQLENNVLELTNIKVLTQENKPLDINSQKRQTKAILLYAGNVPFAINYNEVQGAKTFAPAIISMMPGNAKHFIEKINAAQLPIDFLISKFFPFGSSLAVSKFFHINEITALWRFGDSKPAIFKDIIIAINVNPPINRSLNIHALWHKVNMVFLKYNNKVYTYQANVDTKSVFPKFEEIEIEDYKEELEEEFNRLLSNEQTEKFTGILSTTEGSERVSIEPLKQVLEKKLSKIKTKTTKKQLLLPSLFELQATLENLKLLKL